MEKNRIRWIRRDRDLSGKVIAEALNITPQYYYEIERGEKRLSADMLAKLAEYYDVSTDYLLGRTDDPAPVNPMDQFHTVAAHRSDDPTGDLPEEAKRSLEDFKRYLLKKHGLIKD